MEENKYGIESILSIQEDILDLVELGTDIYEDGEISFWEKGKIAGAITTNGFTIVTNFGSAIQEAGDLTNSEQNQIVRAFNTRALTIFTFDGTHQGDYGIEATKAFMRELKDVTKAIGSAVKDGIDISDVKEIPEIVISIGLMVGLVGQMILELKDLTFEEGMALLAAIPKHIIDAIQSFS